MGLRFLRIVLCYLDLEATVANKGTKVLDFKHASPGNQHAAGDPSGHHLRGAVGYDFIASGRETLTEVLLTPGYNQACLGREGQNVRVICVR